VRDVNKTYAGGFQAVKKGLDRQSGLKLLLAGLTLFPTICLKRWQTFETIRISDDTDGKKNDKNLAFVKKMWSLRILQKKQRRSVGYG
jgi:hypothetical protein